MRQAAYRIRQEKVQMTERCLFLRNIDANKYHYTIRIKILGAVRQS